MQRTLTFMENERETNEKTQDTSNIQLQGGYFSMDRRPCVGVVMDARCKIFS